ncbi:MAG: hypothetical protein ABFS21_10505, partial [Actinomycetota bacterium]
AKEDAKDAKKAEKADKKEAKRTSRRGASGKQQDAQLAPAVDGVRPETRTLLTLEERTAAIKASSAGTAVELEPVPRFEAATDTEPDPVRKAEVDEDEPEDDAAVPAKARSRVRRRRRRADEESEFTPDAEAAREPELALKPAAIVEYDDSSEDGEALPVETRRRIRMRRRHAEEETQPGEEASEDPEDDLNRLWLRAIDVARKYDILGLDRVPIDEELRGQEHEHTWDHRVAWKTGPGARICTICGKVRRKTEEADPADAEMKSQ